VDVQVELESRSLLRDDGRKRPDGATLDPWSHGRPLIWDFTCPDTLAPSHVASSATAAGSAAAQAERNKRAKYSRLSQDGNVLFAPIAIETLGTWGDSAAAICKEIGSRLASLSGDSRSLMFLKQRMSLAIQRGNSASVAGTFTGGDVAL